jgi:phosphoribosyl-ATP pyrophosphohydrolase
MDVTPAERERIQKIIEEASEVIKVCCKILAHGFEVEACAATGFIAYDNRSDLEMESADFFSSIKLSVDSGDLNYAKICEHMNNKSEIITKYMKHQPK